MKLFLIRLKTVFQILTGRNKHWFLVELTTEQLKQSLLNEEFEISIVTHKLQHFNVLTAMNGVINNLHSEDMLLEKLKFETEAELYKTKNSKK